MTTVLLDIDGPLARITLNRPHRLNAVDETLAHDLDRAVTAVSAATDVRVVLIRGAGRAFSSGIDRDMLTRGEITPTFFELTERARLGMESMDKITIAAVHGYCIGGGVQLAIACDIRIATASSRFAVPAVADALIPGMAPIRLPRLIGLGPARRLMLSGAEIGTEEAFRLGLVDHVIPDDDRDAAIAEVIKPYLAAPRTAVLGLKQLLATAFAPPVDTLVSTAAGLFADCLSSAELTEVNAQWRDQTSQRTSHPPRSSSRGATNAAISQTVGTSPP
jgi:enoyl-CoA hydratase/carnithine racemase